MTTAVRASPFAHRQIKLLKLEAAAGARLRRGKECIDLHEVLSFPLRFSCQGGFAMAPMEMAFRPRTPEGLPPAVFRIKHGRRDEYQKGQRRQDFVQANLNVNN